MYNQTQINSFLLCLETNVLYLYQELIKAMSFVAGAVEVRVQPGPGPWKWIILYLFNVPISDIESGKYKYYVVSVLWWCTVRVCNVADTRAVLCSALSDWLRDPTSTAVSDTECSDLPFSLLLLPGYLKDKNRKREDNNDKSATDLEG